MAEATPSIKLVDVEAFRAFVADFSTESDRAAVIVGAAQLDNLLRQILERYLLPVAGSKDDLLDSDAGLGTFSARTHACFRLGLIDPDLTRALHLIRRIRNDFAHETSAKDLSAGAHADRIK